MEPLRVLDLMRDEQDCAKVLGYPIFYFYVFVSLSQYKKTFEISKHYFSKNLFTFEKHLYVRVC